MSMVQAKGRDHSKQVLHQKGWSDPPRIIESFRFQAEDDYENQIFSVLSCAQEPGSFWRENVIAVVILPCPYPAIIS